MKKLGILLTIVFMFALVVAPALAGSKNATYLEWTWPAGQNKSGYFMKTGSGLVHLWYDEHPTYAGAHAVFKPLDHFKNAAENGCGLNTRMNLMKYLVAMRDTICSASIRIKPASEKRSV